MEETKQHPAKTLVPKPESDKVKENDDLQSDMDPPQHININHLAVQAEEEFLLAARHVKLARAQRHYLNKIIDKARSDIENSTPWSERLKCLIGDYAQYMYLPFLEANNQMTVIILFLLT